METLVLINSLFYFENVLHFLLDILIVIMLAIG